MHQSENPSGNNPLWEVDTGSSWDIVTALAGLFPRLESPRNSLLKVTPIRSRLSGGLRIATFTDGVFRVWFFSV